MKKITQEKVMEEAKYFCDVHPERECYSQVQSSSWYGSKFDMMGLMFHLCDECLEEFYAYIKEKYKIETKDIEL